MSYNVPLAGQSINTAQIGIDTTITSGNISCTNISAVNGTINNLTTTIFNPASITTDTIDTANLTVSNSIPVLNIQTLNVSTKNVCQLNVLNASMTNMSVQNLSCTNFTSPDVQHLLVAGENISILNNVITASSNGLIPSNINFSSVNTSSLSVDNSVIIGGTTYITDSLIVSDSITATNITADNLSTAEMTFGNSLTYVPSTKTLDVNTTDTISSGNTLPITSGAVYNSINTATTTISTMWSYMLSESEFILVSSSVAAGGENTICYLDITPQYEGSKIHVEFCFSYSVGGHGTDSIVTEIRVGTNNNVTQSVIQEIFQEWKNEDGGGTRSGAGSTIAASYTNNDSLGDYHRIQLRIDNNSDDSWGLDNSAFVSIKVIEFIETAGTSNPNILIGNGNISCGNLSCSTISITNHTIDNLITTQNVNVGGSMVTVGFPESGVIVPSSMVRLAGGSVVSNYADMEWDGTTFNISTRQGTKNFKVSFGQIAYLEVDSTNVSVQSLKVNQTLEVLGTLIYDDLILNDSLLLNGTFSAFGATFRDDVIFERDVDIEQTLNVSNINVSGNIVCGGTITGSNLSTVALIPGSNITIANNVISAFVESDADIVVSSLHVDNDVDIYGILNVSQTSNFGQSLNVDNQLFVGKAGTTNGDLVLYSANIGDNFEIQNGNTETSFLGTGNISKINVSLGGNQTLSVKPTQVNISGDLVVSGNITGTLDFQNLSATNLSVGTMTVDLIEGDLNAENILCDTVTTTGHVETGKWLVGASDTVTASLYNKDISSVTTHYALHQTNGAATSINGTAVYFKNNGTDVGEWTATGLGVGKTTPTSTLDVSGDSLFTGKVDIVGNLSTENISATTLTTTGFIETGKWHLGALNTTTSELYNKDITSSTTHYAMRQTNGGSTSINGAEIYFKNNSVIIAEINATGLGVGKTTPTKKLDVLGDSLFTGNVNISGTLDADDIVLDNISNINFSGDQITATQIEVSGHIETGKWFIGASDTVTSSLYNKDITSVTTHYALRQTNGGATSLNGTGVYFKNNGTDVGEWTATGLGVGKTTPTSTLDVSGDSLFTGDINVCGSIYSDNVSSTIVNTPLVTSNILDLDGTERILFNIDNVPHMELIEDELYLYVDCIAQTMDVQQKLDGLNMSMTNISTARLTSTNTSVTNLSATRITSTTINTGDVTATGTIDTFELIADESTINFLTVSSNLTTDEVLCDYVHATISILSDGVLVVTGTTTLSGKVNISNDMNISGQLEAETFVGTLQTSLINVPTINVSTLNVSDLINNTEMRTPLMNASTINSSFVLTPTLLNVSYLWSDGTIDFRTNTLPTLAMNNASAKFFQDVNISGTLRADAIEGIDLLNICSTNISTTNLSAGETSATNINCSTLTLSDTAGAGGLDVNGAAYFRGGFFVYTPVQFEADDTYFGEPAGSSTKSRINFWSQQAAYEVGCRLGCDSDDIVRLKLERFGLYTQYNINISNVSTMDMDNTSTKFHQNVNISGTLTADNISGANLSTASFLLGTGLTFALNTLSADFTSVETTIANEIATEVDTSLVNATTANIGFLKLDGIANMSYLNASNVCFTNLSVTNLSATNVSATTLTTSSALLDERVAGSMYLSQKDKNQGYNYALRQTSTGSTTLNTVGNTNLDLNVNNVTIATIDVDGFNVSVSNMSQINASNISAINLSCTELTTSDAAGSTSIISGIKINRVSSELVTFEAPDNELMYAYNTTNGVNAVEGQNRLDLRVNANTKLSIRSTGVRIGNNNAATEMLDVVGNAKISGELTAPTVKHSDDFCRFYKANNTELSSAQTSYLNVFETTGLSSTKVTQTTTSRYTINKAGYYKIYSNMIYENTTYNDRVVYRAQLLVNGNNVLREYGDSFVYTRHGSFGELGSAPVSSLLNLSVNDYIEVYVTLKKASGTFGGTMAGCRVRVASDITFEYLGV